MTRLSISQAKLILSCHPGASAIWTLGVGREPVEVSSRYCDILQRTASELRRERLEARALPEDVAEIDGAEREATGRGQASRIVRYTLPGGGLIRVRATGVPIYNGRKVTGILTALEPLPGALASRALDADESLPHPEPMRRAWRVTVRKRRKSDGRYYQLRYSPPFGEGKEYQRSSGVEDLAAAQAIAQAEEARLNGPAAASTVETAFAAYVRHHKTSGVSPATLAKYEGALRQVAIVLSGQPTRESVARAQDALRARYAASTTRTAMQVAQAAWAWACERGIVQGDWPKVRPVRKRETSLRPPSAAELEALLVAARNYQGGRYWPLVALIYETGCRPSEALSLHGQDVERRESGGVVFFRRRWKTDVSRRAYPISVELLEILPDRVAGEPLFVGVRSGRPMSSASLTNAFKRILEDAGLDEERLAGPSCLRRAWVASAQAAGVRPELSMQLAGHSELSTHAGYARHAAGNAAEEAARAVRLARPALPQDPPEVPPETQGDQKKDAHKETTYGRSENRSCSPPTRASAWKPATYGGSPPQNRGGSRVTQWGKTRLSPS